MSGERPETLQDLLDLAGLTLLTLARRSKVDERTIRLLRDGLVQKARSTTVSGLAKALKMDPSRVRAAIEASRDAAQ